MPIQLQPGGSAAVTLPVDISGALRAATSQAQFQEVATRLDINRTRNQIVYDVQGRVLQCAALARRWWAWRPRTCKTRWIGSRTPTCAIRLQTVAYFDVVRAQTDVANAQRLVIQARNGVSLNVGYLNSAIGIDVTTPLRISDRNAVEQPPGVAPPTVTPLTPQSRRAAGGNGKRAMPPSRPRPEAHASADHRPDRPAPGCGRSIRRLRMGPDFAPAA